MILKCESVKQVHESFNFSDDGLSGEGDSWKAEFTPNDLMTWAKMYGQGKCPYIAGEWYEFPG